MDKHQFVKCYDRIFDELVSWGYSGNDIERISEDSLSLIPPGDWSKPEAYLKALAEMVRKDIIKQN